MSALSWIILLPQLFYIALKDIKDWKITNRSNLLLILSFFVHAAAAGKLADVTPNLLTAGCVFLLLLIPFQCNWLGGGDFKYLIAAHLWLGPFRLMAFSLAMFVGLLIYYVLMKLGVAPVEAKGRSHRIPFGPVGAFALAIALLAGPSASP